jgi:pimeloyl-ACP methyl ester carboxylesterase
MTVKTKKVIAAAAATAAVFAGVAPATAAEAIPADQAVKNVVLVHGAFADGSGWRGVYENLTKRGYHVTIVQNPLTSLADDVAATNARLNVRMAPLFSLVIRGEAR